MAHTGKRKRAFGLRYALSILCLAAPPLVGSRIPRYGWVGRTRAVPVVPSTPYLRRPGRALLNLTPIPRGDGDVLAREGGQMAARRSNFWHASTSVCA